MSSSSDLLVRNYLRSIGGENFEEAAVRTMRARAADGAGVEAAGRGEAAERAIIETLRKLERRMPLDAGERGYLEAIIIPDLRPPVRIRDNSFEITHPAWMHLNDPATKATLTRALPSIGRIELPGYPSLPYGGTGFVAGDGLLMTNRHVVEIFATGLGRAGLVFRSSLAAGIDFRQEEEDDPPDYLDVTAVALIHPYWDMALLRVAGLGAHRRPLPLSLSHADDLRGREVAVIGYPGFDPRNSAAVQNKVFEGVFNVKRLQPGVVHASRHVRSFDNAVLALTHDSSTLGGDSGAAIVDVRTGHVVGLHFGGLYLDANFGVPAYDLALDGRVVDAGVEFAAMPSPGPNAADAAWRALEGEAARAAGAPLAAARSAHLEFEVPIRITIDVAAGAAAGTFVAPAAPAPAAAIEAWVEPFRDLDYGSRRGYDPDFLGVSVPLPLPRDQTIAARVRGGGIELRYHHFSVIMHGKRRLALVTAANVDAAPARKHPEGRPEEDYSRKGLGGLGPHDVERWFTDPRLRADQQLPDRFFTKDRGAFDKGHLTRREDVAWGDTYEELRFANGDTFHVTNCSPQVAGFNRASGENWGGLRLETKDQDVARRRGAALTHMSEQLFEEIRLAHLSPEAARAILIAAALEQSDLLARPATADRARSAPEPMSGARADRVVGAVYKLLAERGASARLDADAAAFLARCGLPAEEAFQVQTTLDVRASSSTMISRACGKATSRDTAMRCSGCESVREIVERRTEVGRRAPGPRPGAASRNARVDRADDQSPSDPAREYSRICGVVRPHDCGNHQPIRFAGKGGRARARPETAHDAR